MSKPPTVGERTKLLFLECRLCEKKAPAILDCRSLELHAEGSQHAEGFAEQCHLIGAD